ncbi:major histocompatibility complex class I-related gene protein-like [Rhineura floridana]|uniref:major histocompatibility complex class I-related gene protein-like n=1 Tax=Rhineura floridana TaxID=261503 RepID=UPI002AC81A33|nr:major histocompatibility complex class I-related gene protein-like [Rhineura floridana]
MGLFRRHFLLFGAAAFLLGGSPGSSSSHSLLYFYTWVSEPSPKLPRYVMEGYVDDLPIKRYGSDTQRMLPLAPWTNQSLNQNYWDKYTWVARKLDKSALIHVQKCQRYNWSTGFHTFQAIYGCELSDNGHESSHQLSAYDGVHTKRVTGVFHYYIWIRKFRDLGLGCTRWLQMYLNDGKEALERKVTPAMKVARKMGNDGLESLICRAYGFYPKKMNATWRKDGEAWERETFSGGILPNSDGTYHTWLSIRIDPQDRKRYRCHVEHASLMEPLDVAWEETALSMLPFLQSPPMVKVVRQAVSGSLETLVCSANGFYPKEINITWRKDGEVLQQEKDCGSIMRNSDGTYRICISIEIDSKDRDRYRCHVEHASLLEPLIVVWEESGEELHGLGWVGWK